MIIDRITLAGEENYLKCDGGIDLSGPAGSYPVVGKHREIVEGELLEIHGVSVLLEAENLMPLMKRQAEPLLSIEVRKEVFPRLFIDPYSHRVHTIGEFEDLNAGVARSMRAMEVDGIPTLVSEGFDETCRWTSAAYEMPRPVRLVAAAWDLAASAHTPEEAFTYSLQLAAKIENQVHPSLIPLTTNPPGPQAPRATEFTPQEHVVAYQVAFEADVDYDAFIRERRGGLPLAGPLGRPLLQAVHLLESVEPAYLFYSLAEAIAKSMDHKLFSEPGGPPKRLSLLLDVTAKLTKGEEISLRVHRNCFEYVEGRLEASVETRPPKPRS